MSLFARRFFSVSPFLLLAVIGCLLFSYDERGRFVVKWISTTNGCSWIDALQIAVVRPFNTWFRWTLKSLIIISIRQISTKKWLAVGTTVILLIKFFIDSLRFLVLRDFYLKTHRSLEQCSILRPLFLQTLSKTFNIRYWRIGGIIILETTSKWSI